MQKQKVDSIKADFISSEWRLKLEKTIHARRGMVGASPSKIPKGLSFRSGQEQAGHLAQSWRRSKGYRTGHSLLVAGSGPFLRRLQFSNEEARDTEFALSGSSREANPGAAAWIAFFSRPSRRIAAAAPINQLSEAPHGWRSERSLVRGGQTASELRGFALQGVHRPVN